MDPDVKVMTFTNLREAEKCAERAYTEMERLGKDINQYGVWVIGWVFLGPNNTYEVPYPLR